MGLDRSGRLHKIEGIDPISRHPVPRLSRLASQKTNDLGPLSLTNRIPSKSQIRSKLKRTGQWFHPTGDTGRFAYLTHPSTNQLPSFVRTFPYAYLSPCASCLGHILLVDYPVKSQPKTFDKSPPSGGVDGRNRPEPEFQPNVLKDSHRRNGHRSGWGDIADAAVTNFALDRLPEGPSKNSTRTLGNAIGLQSSMDELNDLES